MSTARSQWPRARVRQADGDLPLDVIAVEAGEHLQLLELVGAPIDGAVQVRELFARRNEPGRARRRVRRRAAPPPSGPSRAGTGRGGSARRPSSSSSLTASFSAVSAGIDGAVAITGERELVGDARRSIVEPHAAGVGVGGAVVALQLVEHVAERFERPGRGRVERGGAAEVARGRVEVAAVAAPLVGLAAPQVGEHRVGPEGDGAAVGLDGAEGLVVAQGGVAARQQGAVVALRAAAW